MDVPHPNLSRGRVRIAEALEARWRRILETNAFVLGPEVREFEERFAAFLEVPACAAVANGTDALVLALRALGLRPGDEVLVPTLSFFATAEAVVLMGGTPVFCDVEPETLNLDARDAAARVTPRTVGVIGVHLYGRPFDVAAVTALCERHGLWLLEDAAQAQGARLDGKRVGSFGALAAWSFYPTKNLACFGDGGAVSGRDRQLVERVRRLGNHGQTSRCHHTEVGTNSRLDSLQAAVLNCRLPLLDADNARRRELACRYHGGLTGRGDLRLLQDPPGAISVYHQLTILTKRRDELAQHLSVRGVGSSVHYPSLLHRQPALDGLIPDPGEMPVATAAIRELLCLPMYPELTDQEVEAVCAAVRSFYD